MVSCKCAVVSVGVPVVLVATARIHVFAGIVEEVKVTVEVPLIPHEMVEMICADAEYEAFESTRYTDIVVVAAATSSQMKFAAVAANGTRAFANLYGEVDVAS